MCLCTARTRVDLQYASHGILFLTEHIAKLKVLDGFECAFVVGIHFLFRHHFIAVELHSEGKLVGSSSDLFIAVKPFLDVLNEFHLLLGTLRVFPEIGSLSAEVFLLKFYFLLFDVEIAVKRICSVLNIL